MLHLQHFTTARLQAMTLKLELVKLIVWFVSKKIQLKINNNNNNNTVKPHLRTTSVIQSPRYYGHFFMPAQQIRHSFSCNNNNMADFFWPIGDRIDGVPLYTYVNQDQRILSNMYFRKSTTISKILKIKTMQAISETNTTFSENGKGKQA